MSDHKQPIGLRSYWSKRERDTIFWYDKHKPDGHLLHHHLSPLLDELDRRGFDVTTARFQIRRKEAP
jgi:hypothetical protein